MLQVLREPKLDAAGSALDVIFKITSQAMNEFFFILLLSIFLFTSIKANKYTIHPIISTNPMNAEDLNELSQAVAKLENPSLAAKLTNLVGKPIEAGFDKLPASLNQNLQKITEKALTASMRSALFTMKDEPGAAKSNRLHTLGAAVSGGIGGAFGMSALAIELPISTTIIMRSIADVARSEDEPIFKIETRLACMEVFALGSPISEEDDAVESGYYVMRGLLAQSMSAAAHHIASKGLASEGSPALVKMINMIAQRFSIQVSEKLAAQALPIIGAAGGALINAVFIHHFQEIAHGHFTVRRLERKYGARAVSDAYHDLLRA